MSAHIVIVDPRAYLVSDDFTSQFQALITGSIPIDADVTIIADRSDITARPVSGGFFVAAGFTAQISFPVTVTLTFSAPGYDSFSTTIPLPANSVWPIDAGAMPMRRTPIRLQGRVIDVTTKASIAGASVTVVTPGLIAPRTTLHFDHPAGISVNQRSLTPAPTSTQVAAPAAGGTLAIAVQDSSGFSTGDVVSFGAPLDLEYAVIANVNPGEIDLTAPLRRTHAVGSLVQLIVLGPPAGSVALATAAKAGDGLLQLAAPLAADTVEIADGSATEYAIAGALTDTQGFYRLDGITGVAAVALDASAVNFTDSQLNYSLNYVQPVNIINFRLAP